METPAGTINEGVTVVLSVVFAFSMLPVILKVFPHPIVTRPVPVISREASAPMLMVLL